MWEEPKKMDDPAVMLAALKQSGLDADGIAARIQDTEVKQRLIANTEASVARGCFRSPSFFVGDEMWFGKARRRDVEAAIPATASVGARCRWRAAPGSCPIQSRS